MASTMGMTPTQRIDTTKRRSMLPRDGFLVMVQS
jgi:hypothetical protein